MPALSVKNTIRKSDANAPDVLHIGDEMESYIYLNPIYPMNIEDI